MDPVGGDVSEEALRATGFNGEPSNRIANGEIQSTNFLRVSIVGVWWGRWTDTSPKT